MILFQSSLDLICLQVIWESLGCGSVNSGYVGRPEPHVYLVLASLKLISVVYSVVLYCFLFDI